MGKQIEITVTAEIPDDNQEVGHDAIVGTREPVEALCAALKKLGLEAKHSRRLVTRHGERATKAGPVKLAAAE